MVQQRAKFLNGNLFRHVSVISFEASVGLMAVFIVDFVDMVSISMLGKAELAAAIGYAGAILFFTTSFGMASGPAGHSTLRWWGAFRTVPASGQIAPAFQRAQITFRAGHPRICAVVMSGSDGAGTLGRYGR